MDKQKKQQLVKLCTDEFFTHPNWDSVIELIEYYLDDLESVDSIDTNGKTNDEVATELKARQITKSRLRNFIDDTLILQEIKKDVPTRTRKYK